MLDPSTQNDPIGQKSLLEQMHIPNEELYIMLYPQGMHFVFYALGYALMLQLVTRGTRLAPDLV